MKKLLVSFVIILNSFSPSTETVSVGVELLDYLPFYKGKGRGYSGFSRDLLNEFSKDSGVEFTCAPCRIDQLFDKYFRREFYLKFPYNKNWNAGGKKGKNVKYSTLVTST